MKILFKKIYYKFEQKDEILSIIWNIYYEITDY